MSDESNEPELPPQHFATREEYMQYQHQMMHMEMERGKHAFLRVFDSFSTEQLQCLSSCFAQIKETPEAAAYYEGCVDMRLNDLHNVCLACGKNHRTELGLDEDHPEQTSDRDADGDTISVPVEPIPEDVLGVADEVDPPKCEGPGPRLGAHLPVPMQAGADLGSLVCPVCGAEGQR